ncbi:hypothetical protein ACQ4P5_13845 [Ralstonia sp. L16]|uniref:hypothetical protein n=1 Tax=Ralstonia sp. L16 TaxID=3423950 RepID=UPI003F791516
MSLRGRLLAAHWQRCTPTYIKALPVLDFPFVTPPDIYAPASTVLRFGDGNKVYAFQWCYLRREGVGRGVIKSFDVSSLSEVRVNTMPLVLERLSKWFRFNNARPRSVERALHELGFLLSWADQPQHAGRFEALLGDPDLALEALKGYHTYLRNQLQSHQLASRTASDRDQGAIACLSEVHGRVYKDHIEPLQCIQRQGTEAPDAQAVGKFSSTLQAIFDSAAEMVLVERPVPPQRLLRVSASDDSKTVELRASYGPLRLMELACVTFAGLVFVDSGANLSVLTDYEEPEDLEAQLAEPDRINLTQKAVKFRAGGKEVEVHLSATTMTRLKRYLRVRQALVAALGGADIAPMFVQCKYGNLRGEPIAVCALDQDFLGYIRRKVIRIGASLPSVTLRQLRAYKQVDWVRRAPVAVAAKVMGHSVKTAITTYCKAQEATRQGEMAEFLGSLQKTILAASEDLPGRSHQKVIPIGICADHGNPAPPTDSSAVVAPDCSKVEGCFFCDNYRLHADAEDMRKLMSCRRVLKYIVPLNEDSVRAERIYTAVVDRIDALLGELKRRQPRAYETVREEIEERGQLTRYWAGKLQQLHLLGMLPASTA